MPRHVSNHRISVAARILAAVVGGYILTQHAVAALALLLPIQPSEASLTATMLSFAIYAAIVVAVFATRSVWRMGLVLGLAIAIATALEWAPDALGWR